MATIDSNLIVPIPTLTAAFTSVQPIYLSKTISKPTLTAYMDFWNVSAIAPLPTLTASILQSTFMELNKSVPKPTLVASIRSGNTIRLSEVIYKPQLNFTATSTLQYALVTIVPKPKLLANSYASILFSLNKNIKVPTLVAHWDNQLVNNTYVNTLVNPVTTTNQNTYVLNTFTAAHSTYSNFSFNSYFKLDGKYYGIDSTGVYELSGSLDEAAYINSEVDLPVSSYDKQGLKACTDAIIFGRLAGNMEVVVTTDEQRQRSNFIVKQDSREGLHRIRTKIPKGLKGSTIQFTLKNVNGSAFSINNLEVFLRELQRIR